MKKTGGLLNLIFYFINLQDRYTRIKADEEKAKKSVVMGISSIIQSILSVVVVFLCVWGAIICFKHIASALFLFTLIGFFACVACGLAMFVNGFIGGLVCAIYQLKINKKAIGYVSIVIWFLCFGGMIAAAIFFFKKYA